MDSIKAESSGTPAAPEMRAMTLDRRNLPAIRDAEMGAASFVPQVDLDAVHRLIAAALPRLTPGPGNGTACSFQGLATWSGSWPGPGWKFGGIASSRVTWGSWLQGPATASCRGGRGGPPYAWASEDRGEAKGRWTRAQKPGIPLTVCLGSKHSTPELRPLMGMLSM